MKLCLVLSIFFLIPLQCFAQLEKPSFPDHFYLQKVDGSSLKIMGKGIENRKTGETLGFVCTGEPVKPSIEPSCNELRMVYFNSSKTEAYIFGIPLLVSPIGTSPNPVDLKVFFKDFSQEFKRTKRTHRNDSIREELAIVGGSAVGIGSLFACVAAQALWPLGVGAAIFYGGVTLISVDPILFSESSSVNAFRDQDGWNWSVQPKKISKKSFDLLLNMQNLSGVIGLDILPFRN